MRSDEYRKAWIECSLNKKGDLGGRDDCAQELASFNDSAVIEALKQVACNEVGNETILDSAGESLGLIWARRRKVYPNGIQRSPACRADNSYLGSREAGSQAAY